MKIVFLRDGIREIRHPDFIGEYPNGEKVLVYKTPEGYSFVDIGADVIVEKIDE